LLTQIFRFFTQADVEVQNCYHEHYGRNRPCRGVQPLARHHRYA
jgi:hypothetical protein